VIAFLRRTCSLNLSPERLSSHPWCSSLVRCVGHGLDVPAALAALSQCTRPTYPQIRSLRDMQIHQLVYCVVLIGILGAVAQAVQPRWLNLWQGFVRGLAMRCRGICITEHLFAAALLILATQSMRCLRQVPRKGCGPFPGKCHAGCGASGIAASISNTRGMWRSRGEPAPVCYSVM
jgi:hypothetical protein